jgi:hypothetical protein
VSLESYVTELYDRPYQPESLGVETEEEADTDEKYSTFCTVKWGKKTIKQRKDKNATADDVVHVREDALLLLGEDGFQLMAFLINNINETGEWTKVVTEVSIIVL